MYRYPPHLRITRSSGEIVQGSSSAFGWGCSHYLHWNQYSVQYCTFSEWVFVSGSPCNPVHFALYQHWSTHEHHPVRPDSSRDNFTATLLSTDQLIPDPDHQEKHKPCLVYCRDEFIVQNSFHRATMRWFFLLKETSHNYDWVIWAQLPRKDKIGLFCKGYCLLE